MEEGQDEGTGERAGNKIGRVTSEVGMGNGERLDREAERKVAWKSSIRGQDLRVGTRPEREVG